MKRILLGALVAVGLVFGAISTQAGPYDTQGINCGDLKGTPKMCVKNGSAFAITGVAAVPSMMAQLNMAQLQWVPLNGGPIPVGGMTIVTFPAFAPGQTFDVVVRTASGTTHRFRNVDVFNMTSFNIGGW